MPSRNVSNSRHKFAVVAPMAPFHLCTPTVAKNPKSQRKASVNQSASRRRGIQILPRRIREAGPYFGYRYLCFYQIGRRGELRLQRRRSNEPAYRKSGCLLRGGSVLKRTFLLLVGVFATMRLPFYSSYFKIHVVRGPPISDRGCEFSVYFKIRVVYFSK